MNAYLGFYELVISIIRPTIVIALLAGFWIALKRTDLSAAARRNTWLAVAVPLVAWLALVWVMAGQGRFEVGRAQLPLVPLAVFLPLIVALPPLLRSRQIAAALDAAPPQWLVGIQIYRLIGANFIALWAFDAIPGVFALPAGIGDVIVGLLALPVAFYVASRATQSRAAAVAWNLLGIADLASALTFGMLTTPGPLHHLVLDHPNLLTSAYPTVLTPVFAVPLSLMLHALSLRQLRRRSSAPRAGMSAPHQARTALA